MDTIGLTQAQIEQKYLPSHYETPQQPQPRLWTIINNFLPHRSRDVQFWWRTTGIPLAILLQKSDYPFDAQCRALFFYWDCVVPELGVGPNADGLPRYWKSFMTDHFCPIEFSWEWGYGEEKPMVRFSIEPIGPCAGTGTDPLNRYATSNLVHQYQHLFQECDLTLFDHFSKELLSYDKSALMIDFNLGHPSHRSRTFVAFDLSREGIMLKAYFLPMFKTAESGQSCWELIAQSIHNLPNYSPSNFAGFSMLQNYLVTSPIGCALEVEILGIDCVKPIKSRIKIYVRSRSTSFSSVRDVMTLGGAKDSTTTAHGIAELWKLWKFVLSLDQHVLQADELHPNNHRTAGILYYFDLKQGDPRPGVKVYIPIRHYGRNDLAVAEGLQLYMADCKQANVAAKYIEALKSIFPANSLRNQCGAQTYLGCSICGGELKLTSYIAPEVFKMHQY